MTPLGSAHAQVTAPPLLNEGGSDEVPATLRTAVALHSWNGQGTSGEAGGYLVFAEGARIEMLDEGGAGDWWQGGLGGVGVVPIKFH